MCVVKTLSVLSSQSRRWCSITQFAYTTLRPWYTVSRSKWEKNGKISNSVPTFKRFSRVRRTWKLKDFTWKSRPVGCTFHLVWTDFIVIIIAILHADLRACSVKANRWLLAKIAVSVCLSRVNINTIINGSVEWLHDEATDWYTLREMAYNRL